MRSMIGGVAAGAMVLAGCFVIPTGGSDVAGTAGGGGAGGGGTPGAGEDQKQGEHCGCGSFRETSRLMHTT